MLRAPALLAAASWWAAAACSDSDPAAPPEVCKGAAVAAARAAAGGAGHRSQCGPTQDFTPVNEYAGALAEAQTREDAVALLGGSCTGTLIAAASGPVMLTAGHCANLGDRVVVAFNVEMNADGDPLVTEATVIERAEEPDYALLRLDQLPAATAPTPLTSAPSERLSIIQHPRGRPKVIAEGDFLGSCDRLVYYADLDTLVGSSGAGVLSQSGSLLGIHTDGDCTADGKGTNVGWTAESIVAASAYLQDIDIAAR
jgi:hypothetical protein